MTKLSVDNIKHLHTLVAKYSGGSAGLRDEGLLNSAVEGIYQSFAGKDLYPTLEEKGARLGFSLISNHAFLDGNKRIGILSMLVFFEINGVKLNPTDQDIIDAGLGVASGKMSYEDLLNWVKQMQIKKNTVLNKPL